MFAIQTPLPCNVKYCDVWPHLKQQVDQYYNNLLSSFAKGSKCAPFGSTNVSCNFASVTQNRQEWSDMGCMLGEIQSINENKHCVNCTFCKFSITLFKICFLQLMKGGWQELLSRHLESLENHNIWFFRNHTPWGKGLQKHITVSQLSQKAQLTSAEKTGRRKGDIFPRLFGQKKGRRLRTKGRLDRLRRKLLQKLLLPGFD